MDLQVEVRSRFGLSDGESLRFKYKSPLNNRFVSLIVDIDVRFMVRLHREFRMKIIDLLAEHHDQVVVLQTEIDNSSQDEGCATGNSLDSWIRAIVGVGQSFDSAAEFRTTLKKYSIARRKSYDYKKNEPDKIIVKCCVQECDWRIYAAYGKSDDRFAIRNCNLQHTCDETNVVGRGHLKADSRLIAELVQPKLSSQPLYKPITVKNDLLRKYGVDIPYRRAWLGKERAIENIHGGHKASYDRLRWYCNAIKLSNPGSVADCEVYPETNKFRRIFICFDACISGFVRGCRPLIFLDGTHIKNKHKGCLLSAVSKDADDGLFTVAFAVVDAEKNCNWEWFLIKLRSVLIMHGRDNFRDYTFFSDRHEGLINGVQSVFHGSYHAYCLRHLVDNFKNQVLKYHPGSDKKHWTTVLKNAAYAVEASRYTFYIDQIIKTFPKEGYEFIKQSNPNCWANSMFRGKRWGIINNNIAECWNSWVQDARVLPIVGMLDEIRRKIMIMMNDKTEESHKLIGFLCNNPEKKLKTNIDESRTLQLDRSCGWKFEVSDNANRFAVDLDAKTCSCKYYQLHGIPCKHACSCILSLQLSPYVFCDSFYSAEKYRETYVSYINPIPTNEADNLPMVEDVGQPDVPRPPGRPRTKRIPSQIEDVRPLKCGRCKRNGHNRRTCKEPI